MSKILERFEKGKMKVTMGQSIFGSLSANWQKSVLFVS